MTHTNISTNSSNDDIDTNHSDNPTFASVLETRLTRWRLAGNSVHVGSVREVASLLGACA